MGHIHLQNYAMYNPDMDKYEPLAFSSLGNHSFEVKLDQIIDVTFSVNQQYSGWISTGLMSEDYFHSAFVHL